VEDCNYVPATKPTWEKAYYVVEPQINAEGVHVWPFDASFPIDIRFFDVNGGPDIRMNRHDYFELFYACSGKGVCQVQDRRFAVKKGDLVIIGSSLYHRILGNHGQSMKAIVLFFQPDLVRAGAPTGEDMQYLMPFFVHDHNFPHVIPASEAIPSQVLELIQRVHAELPATSNRARLAVKTYLKMILMLLVNHYSAYLGTRETFSRKESAIQRLRPLFEYLEAHYDGPIRVEDAARICATSSSHFMYFFKRVTGQSFLAYLNHFRVAKAQALLGSTDKSISEISQEIGFCDQSHFGVVFRKLVGMTPLAYRRRFRGIGDHGESFELHPVVSQQDSPNQVHHLAAVK
jgi:AraC-like DNA-binding protein/mannose-6-phosphate isomerase-like protein (cupin superfamily)